MRCYNFYRDQIMEGIPVFYQHGTPGILLGSYDGYHRFLNFHNYNPPEVIVAKDSDSRDVIQDAFPVHMSAKNSGATFVVFAKPDAKHDGDQRMLIRYSTAWSRTNFDGFEGFVTCEDRDSEIIHEYTVRGQYREGVVRMSPGSIIKVQYNDRNMEPRVIYQPLADDTDPETGFFSGFLAERAYADPVFSIEDQFHPEFGHSDLNATR